MRSAIKPHIKDVYIPSKPIALTAEKEIEFGCSLPDYSPDILAIIRAECIPTIESVKASAGKCIVDGRAEFRLLYATGYNGKTRSATFVKQFSHAFDYPSGVTDAVCRATAETTSVTCRLSDVRSPLFKAGLFVKCSVHGNDRIKCVDTDSSSGYYFKTKEISLRRPAVPDAASAEITGEILLGRGDMPASEIISHSVLLQPPRITVQQNRVSLRSDAHITVIYETESGTTSAVTRSMPVAIDIDSDNGDIAEPECEIAVGASSVILAPDNYGENRLFKVKLNISGKVYTTEVETINLAADMFAEGSHTQCEESKMCYIADESIFTKTFSLDMRLAPAEPLDALLCSKAEFHGVTAMPVDGGVRISGVCCAEVLGTNEHGIGSAEQCDAFEQLSVIDTADCEITGISLCPLDIQANMLSDGTISFRITYEAKIFCCKTAETSFIVGVTKEEPVTSIDDGMTAAYYFQSLSDDLWSIAKHYATDPAAIREQNMNAFDADGAIAAGTPYIFIKL